MADKMRAKFQCHQAVSLPDGSRTIHAQPVTSGSEENKSFSLYTPSGSLTLTISNPNVVDLISQGQEFYLDFTPIPKEGS